jgi:uncharacterized protein (TIGR00375 family)
MNLYNADLHIHGPHSIAVSQSLNLDTMSKTAEKKGLHILGTGDILQPDWLKYMEKNLKVGEQGNLFYKNLNFILQSEIEDVESIHHLVLFPDFNAVRDLRDKFEPYSKNISNEWGGRPRVNLSPAEITESVCDVGGIIGPAHAFTPFRAIFRQGKFQNLKECYQGALNKVDFLELGLSANTELADRMESLKGVTFLSNSDAHSEDPRSLGREFNKFEIDNPSFEEIVLAIKREEGRKVILNVGLHPKLGKYYNMFCGKCRRRIIFKQTKKKIPMEFSHYSVNDDFVIFYSKNPTKSRDKYIRKVADNKMVCPKCKEKTGKNYKIKLGVSERLDVISDYLEAKHPQHRPPYINAIPLIDIIRSIKGIKSTNSKTVSRAYDKFIKEFGQEYDILLNISINKIRDYNEQVAQVIEAFRNDEIQYTPGGGGTYGRIKLDI